MNRAGISPVASVLAADAAQSHQSVVFSTTHAQHVHAPVPAQTLRRAAPSAAEIDQLQKSGVQHATTTTAGKYIASPSHSLLNLIIPVIPAHLLGAVDAAHV